MFNYALLQFGLWALLHAGFLFWGVAFPFSFRQLRITNRIRHAHVISVLVAVLVPLLGALVPLKEGFLLTNNPTLVCLGRSADYTFYTLLLPISVAMAATSCLLFFIFWTIFKVQYICMHIYIVQTMTTMNAHSSYPYHAGRNFDKIPVW